MIFNLETIISKQTTFETTFYAIPSSYAPIGILNTSNFNSGYICVFPPLSLHSSVSFCQATHCLSCPLAVPEVPSQGLLFWELSFGLPWWYTLHWTFRLLCGDLFFFKNKANFIYLLIFGRAGSSLLMGFPLVVVSRRCFLAVVCRLLIAAASFVAEHGL